MDIVAFVSFVALVVAWLAAPSGERAGKPTVASSLRIGEAKA